jgi:hypothetical protein
VLFTGPAFALGDGQEILQLLPDPTQINAEIIEGPERFSPDNLYEYINGAAEAFLAYDFDQLAHQVYLVAGTEVTVDIYDMGNSLDAFGIYSSERARDSEFLEIGVEAYRNGDILNFLQNRYYVKLDAFSESGDTSSLLTDFAGAVSAKLPEAGGLPEIFARAFPSAGLVAHSRTYVKGAPLGHRFLSPAYLAEYSSGSETMTVLVSPSHDSEAAMERIRRMRDHLAKVGEVVPEEKWGREAYFARTKYQGDILALSRGHFAVVLAGVNDSHETLLTELLSGLQEQVAK